MKLAKNIEDELLNLESMVSEEVATVKNIKAMYKKDKAMYKKDKARLNTMFDMYKNGMLFLLASENSISNSINSIIQKLFAIALNIDYIEAEEHCYGKKYCKFSNECLQDKAFKNFLMYSLQGKVQLKNYQGTMFEQILFTYMFQDKKPTLVKIRNFLSWYIRKIGIKIDIRTNLTNEQKVVFEQIMTGVKYEKEKNMTPANNQNYTKKENKHFSIKNASDNFIKIKYISNQEYKHRFHRRPIEHTREGHYRFYKNTGKKVWIPPTIINKGVA